MQMDLQAGTVSLIAVDEFLYVFGFHSFQFIFELSVVRTVIGIVPVL